MRFSQAFSAVAHKRLAEVDLPDRSSHQHELNGTRALREFFGDEEATRGDVTWVRFAEHAEPAAETGEFTFYDARAKSAERTRRSEWRFYYSGEPLADSEPGDLREDKPHPVAVLAAIPQLCAHALIDRRLRIDEALQIERIVCHGQPPVSAA